MWVCTCAISVRHTWTMDVSWNADTLISRCTTTISYVLMVMTIFIPLYRLFTEVGVVSSANTSICHKCRNRGYTVWCGRTCLHIPRHNIFTWHMCIHYVWIYTSQSLLPVLLPSYDTCEFFHSLVFTIFSLASRKLHDILQNITTLSLPLILYVITHNTILLVKNGLYTLCHYITTNTRSILGKYM